MESKKLILDNNNFDLLINENTAKIIMEKSKPYLDMMLHYKCALKEVATKFDVLNEELSLKRNENPVETIKTRLKTPLSISEKLSRLGHELTVENIKLYITDVAGVRVICSFVDDIYLISDMFMSQNDIKIIKIKDYIKNPKESGYRSLHIIVEIPIFLSKSVEMVKVEVQFRTIAMDFWASLEHKLKYKKNIDNPEIIANELKQCAKDIARLDFKMQEIANKISKSK